MIDFIISNYAIIAVLTGFTSVITIQVEQHKKKLDDVHRNCNEYDMDVSMAVITFLLGMWVGVGWIIVVPAYTTYKITEYAVKYNEQ